MKSDFDSMMSNLDQEMEAGRSKLAKLREKIRRTKANIKAADDAEAAEDAKRAEAKASWWPALEKRKEKGKKGKKRKIAGTLHDIFVLLSYNYVSSGWNGN